VETWWLAAVFVGAAAVVIVLTVRARSRPQEQPARAPRRGFVWITSFGRGVDHAVAEEQAIAGAEHSGVYQGVCGAEFLPAPMECGPEFLCASCTEFLWACWERRTPLERPGTATRRGWQSRLGCRAPEGGAR
jgi:hypothetical protein